MANSTTTVAGERASSTANVEEGQVRLPTFQAINGRCIDNDPLTILVYPSEGISNADNLKNPVLVQKGIQLALGCYGPSTTAAALLKVATDAPYSHLLNTTISKMPEAERGKILAELYGEQGAAALRENAKAIDELLTRGVAPIAFAPPYIPGEIVSHVLKNPDAAALSYVLVTGKLLPREILIAEEGIHEKLLVELLKEPGRDPHQVLGLLLASAARSGDRKSTEALLDPKLWGLNAENSNDSKEYATHLAALDTTFREKTGVSISEARMLATINDDSISLKDRFLKAREVAPETLRENFGDVLLRRAEKNPEIKKYLRQLSKIGSDDLVAGLLGEKSAAEIETALSNVFTVRGMIDLDKRAKAAEDCFNNLMEAPHNLRFGSQILDKGDLDGAVNYLLSGWKRDLAIAVLDKGRENSVKAAGDLLIQYASQKDVNGFFGLLNYVSGANPSSANEYSPTYEKVQAYLTKKGLSVPGITQAFATAPLGRIVSEEKK